jgi:segregation and condensation protein B
VNEDALAISQEPTPEDMVPRVDYAGQETETGESTPVENPPEESVTQTRETQGVDQELRYKVEAVLFATDKALHAQAIARILNVDVQLVRQAILELIEQYESRPTALEIIQDNGYVIEVKSEYSTIMQEFLPLDIPTSLLRTLSVIAIRAPVAQSEIVQMRGASAYDHIRELVERDLVHKKEEGRSPILTTTKKFQQYFRLSSDGSELRQYVKQQERLLAAQEQERRKREEEAAAEGEQGTEGQGTEEGSVIQTKLPVVPRESITRTPILEIQKEIPSRKSSPENDLAPLQDFTPAGTENLTDE